MLSRSGLVWQTSNQKSDSSSTLHVSFEVYLTLTTPFKANRSTPLHRGMSLFMLSVVPAHPPQDQPGMMELPCRFWGEAGPIGICMYRHSWKEPYCQLWEQNRCVGPGSVSCAIIGDIDWTNIFQSAGPLDAVSSCQVRRTGSGSDHSEIQLPTRVISRGR